MPDGFETFEIDVGETTIFARRKGTGRPLLLHGFPETHLVWHRVASALAEDFTIVCADLRGYGSTGKPASTPKLSGDFKSFSICWTSRNGPAASPALPTRPTPIHSLHSPNG